MKARKNLTVAFLTLALVATSLVSGCREDNSALPEGDLKSSEIKNNTEASDNCSCIINPSDEITPEEEVTLIYIREEEKLARDVYSTLYGQYSLRVFDNISKSEQRHMDKVWCLLEYYNIEDPASEEIGVFTNPDLQDLYNNLVEQGSESLAGALTVGATIEDLDIFDLNQAIEMTENEAIITIFGHLRCGSKNHMRAFSNLLANNNVDYTPQFISQEEYEEILSGTNGPCGNGNGNGNRNGNRNGNGNGNGNGNRNGNGNGNGNGNCGRSGN
jgi:hypothetical protein